MLPVPTLILLALVVIGPVVTWVSMQAHEALVVDGAVKGERLKQVATCQRQLADQITTIEANTMSGIGAAGAAADSIQPTPVSEFEIAALCRISPECRSRGKTP